MMSMRDVHIKKISIFLALLGSSIVLLFFGFIGYFLYSFFTQAIPLFPTFKAVSYYNGVLKSEKWIQHIDKNLGISFMYPSSWSPVRDNKKPSYWTQYKYSISPGSTIGGMYFYKSEKDTGMKKADFISEKRTINGADYIMYHSKKKYQEYGLTWDGYLISEDAKIVIRLDISTFDTSPWVLKKRDEIMKRFAYSIKPL